MSTEVKTEKSLETIRKAVIPVVRLLAGRLGWMVDDQTIARIGLSPFPQSPLEESVVQLCVEVCRAYSGSPQALTEQNLVCRAIKLVPWKHFLLERELSQCAEYCVPFYGDDMRPETALKALGNSRSLPCYQEPLGAVLSIEVLARLVRWRGGLRDELLPIMQIISNNTWNPGNEIQQYLGHRKAVATQKEEE